ncbi:MAG TPA: hypothetical protein VGE52_15895, partial [Pirellulales bacterium]
ALSRTGEIKSEPEWELFLAAYTSSQRTRTLFDRVLAKRKIWLVFPEYGYSSSEFPTEESYSQHTYDEDQFINGAIAACAPLSPSTRVCIDITGFVRPYLLYLLKCLHTLGLRKFQVLYAEPRTYAKRENTQFSDEAVVEVRQVTGFEGTHSTRGDNDLLVISSGYEDSLIARVAESKTDASKLQMFGFPPLAPDMYQENILRAMRAQEATGADHHHVLAPANDPFVTASVLSSTIHRLNLVSPISNLYLAPLATKPQVLAFGLYFLAERQNTATSIVFPYCRRYARETSAGVGRVWQYTVEF